MNNSTKSIAYSDGEIENSILELVKHSTDNSSSRDIACEYYEHWPVEYHLCSARSNCVKHLNFSGLDVLEFGAGMGAMSRFMAEKANSLTVVEGTERRFNVLKERLRDLHNWTGHVCNYEDFNTDKKFDVVCFFGVLEYAGRYIQQADPFLWALHHAKSFLKDGGVILVTIENKNGFKYFAGASEDHYGRHFAGICGYPLKNDIKTFSRKEMLALFQRAGLPEVETQHLWPDYKLTNAVLMDSLVESDPTLSAAIASSYPFRDYSGQKMSLMPEALALDSLGSSGLLGEFSNSYLFLASEVGSTVKNKLLRLTTIKKVQAITYTMRRKYPVRTSILKKNGELIVEKDYLDPRTPESIKGIDFDIFIKEYKTTPVYRGPKVSFVLTNYLYYGYNDDFWKTLDEFFSYIFETYKTADPQQLDPQAFDAILHNTIITEQGFQGYDFEYRLSRNIPKSFFIYRVALPLRALLPFAKFPVCASWEDFYQKLCERYNVTPQFKQDIIMEIAVQQTMCRW